MAEQQTEQGGTKVVVAVDGSGQADSAFLYYLKELHKESNTVLITVCKEIPYVPMEVRHEVAERLLADEGERLKPIIDKYNQMLQENNMRGRVVSGFGRPGEYIVQVAEQEGAKLIVTGTRGMGTLRRTILGSVSDYVVHHAHCPVVICRQPKKH